MIGYSRGIHTQLFDILNVFFYLVGPVQERILRMGMQMDK